MGQGVRNLQLRSAAFAYAWLLPHQPEPFKMKKPTHLAQLLVGALLAGALWVSPAAAQTAPSQSALMQKLDLLKGTWVGETKGMGQTGNRMWCGKPKGSARC